MNKYATSYIHRKRAKRLTARLVTILSIIAGVAVAYILVWAVSGQTPPWQLSN